LQSDGYRTVLLGKYLNGYPATASPTYIPPGWTEWYVPAAGHPYSNFNYTLNENGTLVPYGSAPEDYLTDVVAGKAGADLESGRDVRVRGGPDADLPQHGRPAHPAGRGRALAPSFAGPTPAASNWRKMVFVEQYPFERHTPPPASNGTLEPLDPADLVSTGPAPFYKGLRTHTYKYIEYDTGEKEFYELVRDPSELQNQASRLDPAFQAQLAAAVQAFATCAGNTCRSAEQIALPPSPVYVP